MKSKYEPIIKAVVSQIASQRSTKIRPTSFASLQKVTRILLGNLLNALVLDPMLFVAVPRRPAEFGRTRYKGEIGFRIFNEVLTYFVQSGWVEIHSGFFHRSENQGKRTRIKNKSKGISAFKRFLLEHDAGEECDSGDDHKGISFLITGNKTGMPSDVRHFEVIRLRDAARELCNYQDTPETNGMRQRLMRWNTFAAGHWVDILVRNDGTTELSTLPHALARSDDEAGELGLVNLSHQGLYRVFNIDFSRGGRFYGGAWQQVRRVVRPLITINGQLTRELDFRSVHIGMLYAQSGSILEDDPYSLDGIDPVHRKLIKITLMKMINARGSRIARPEGMPMPANVSWSELQDRIAAKHGPIQHFLRSGVGVLLQRKDSDVCEAIIMQLMEKGVLALPLHDSFIVAEAHEEELRREMIAACIKCVGVPMSIRVDPSLRELVGEGCVGPNYVRQLVLRPEYSFYRARWDVHQAQCSSGSFAEQ